MNAPTLLVGLGGAGSKIICRVSKMVTEEQSRNLGFVVFDTDINEQREIIREYPFVKTVQTSTKLTVGEYLSIDHHARDSWFPVNAVLNSKTLTEGAGQVRAISRLAFDTAIRAGKLEPLHEAIQNLFKLEQTQNSQALRVIIVSSLAGGTGSGLIIPVAMYIKNYLKTHFRQSANITRGFFILPEVFYEVIPGADERNNLKSNAYATLRELDAFLMQGDDTLPEKFSAGVRMEVPRPSGQGYDEYHVRPYDFCFLFDAQNSEGCKLNSFDQYLQHAANCIFAQSIGPMNKRSNSSEDNTIRRLCAERGRNRYAGAGSSVLHYPMEDVRDYVALHWAKECVSKQWLVYDKMYADACRQAALARAAGNNVPNPVPAAHYIDTVETMNKNKDPFTMAIVNACTSFDTDGITKIGDNWTAYVSALTAKVAADESSGQDRLDQLHDSIDIAIKGITGETQGEGTWTAFVDTYIEMEKYRAMVFKRCNDVARTIGYSLFHAPNENIVNDRLPHQLETYMRNADGKFIHPNAIRYFLYKALEAMRLQKAAVDTDIQEITEFLGNFARTAFDDPKTPDEIETVDSLTERKVSLAAKLSKKLTSEQEDLKRKYAKYLECVDSYRVNAVLSKVLEEGITYVTAVSEAFRMFYNCFEVRVSGIDKRIGTIAKRYEQAKGMTTRYVCASEECLKAIANDLVYAGDSLNIDSELCSEIYSRVRAYSLMDSKPANDDYFGDIFESGIIGHYRNSLMSTYSSIIDVDVISALENEAKYISKGLMDDSRVEQYVIKAITETRALSCPFIEKPLGEERDPIYACTYHPALNPEDTSPRARLVDKYLRNAGGEPDDSVGRNMIVFYQSFYGLRANDLSKFAPPERSATYNREGGEYYKAYFELISKIHPESHKSKAITPHIDRWWHVPTMMPDLDDGNQAAQEQHIYSAFFWSLLGGFVDMYDEGGETLCYGLDVEKFDDSGSHGALVVSNGTPCDHLYEVLDALSIYPEMVDKILARVEMATARDVDFSDVSALEDSYLYSCMESFRVREFPLGEDSAYRSIFDLPMLMRRSVKADMVSYFEENALNILKAELDEIKKYLHRICSDKEFPTVMGNLIKAQFEKFLEDTELEQDKYKDVYHSTLFRRICSTVVTALESIGLYRDAKALDKRIKELTR